MPVDPTQTVGWPSQVIGWMAGLVGMLSLYVFRNVTMRVATLESSCKDMVTMSSLVKSFEDLNTQREEMRRSLEQSINGLRETNREALDRVSAYSRRMEEKLDKSEEKAAETRHKTLDTINELNLKVGVLIQTGVIKDTLSKEARARERDRDDRERSRDVREKLRDEK